jgi:hypothetical protein
MNDDTLRVSVESNDAVLEFADSVGHAVLIQAGCPARLGDLP